MIAGNPDHRDDASLKIHQNIPPWYWHLSSAQCLVPAVAHITCHKFPRPGPGALDHTGNDTPLHNVTRLMEPPEEQHTADILIRSRLLIVTQF